MQAPELGIRNLLGTDCAAAMARAGRFLARRSPADLLECVGRTLPRLALRRPAADKDCFPASFSGQPCRDDLLAGQGMFYVTEAGRVMLDCTSGHYQMTWGYNHPALCAAIREALDRGVVWDNHSNIPGLPVKQLAAELVALARGTGLDRVLLAVCTGSAACGAALKIMLVRYARDRRRARQGPPVMIVLAGNYHGTDLAAQTMRGMWPGLVAGMQTIQVEPNDRRGLETAFRKYGRRVAGFWAEPLMMNREAFLVDGDYLRLARKLCTRHDALMALDEIQTGFWYPEIFLFRRLKITPDIVILGKGLTAGFHPLAGLLFRRELDILAQYDALNTNGNASLAAYVALGNLRLIRRHGDRLRRLAERHENGWRSLAGEFPKLIARVNGSGYLAGLKFRRRADALGFHRAALARGLWLRAHAYHPGHRTVLAKFALVADEQVIDHVRGVAADLLAGKSWR